MAITPSSASQYWYFGQKASGGHWNGTISEYGIWNTALPASQIAWLGASGGHSLTAASDWIDVKAFGAVGDGQHDDTAAIQAAINCADSYYEFSGATGEVGPTVYLPAGTYVITGTLQLHGVTNATSLWPTMASLVGQDPATTIIKWEGADSYTTPSGTVTPNNPSGADYPTDIPPAMIWLDGEQGCSYSRITLDGAGHNVIGVIELLDLPPDQGDSSADSYTDMVFEDMSIGIQSGYPDANFGGGCDNITVTRCGFYRCSDAGLLTSSANAYENFIFDSRFINNAYGITRRRQADVYNCFFQGSTVSDISSGWFVDYSGNTSIDSNRFYLGGNYGIAVTFENNTILDCQAPDGVAILIFAGGNVTLLDNQIRNRPGATGPAVAMIAGDDTDLASIGNQYSSSNPIQVVATNTGTILGGPRRTRIGANLSALTGAMTLPGTPSNTGCTVFEVTTASGGDSTAALNNAIASAAAWDAQNPGGTAVVHIPYGTYLVSQTVVVPGDVPIQIAGDPGGGTTLKWNGGPASPRPPCWNWPVRARSLSKISPSTPAAI